MRLALALGLVSALSALFNLLAILALGGAIAHLGAPQGPLDFALAFIGTVLGLGGDALILRGAVGVALPRWRLAGAPVMVSWGLGLQLVAAAAVGLLESSWLVALVYVLLLAGLAVLWLRTSPSPLPRPRARHPEPERPPEGPEPTIRRSFSERQSIPWVGSAPPPPSAPPPASADPLGPERRERR